MSTLLSDKWFLACVDRAIERCGKGLSPRQIGAFKRALAHTFETHPMARKLLQQSRPDLMAAVDKNKN
ncbi:MAG: hypothetical protein IPK82_11420 [Polyangiaceae bacterium]|nr:hypothetical protein [Polyangiaceae bacterium]